MKLRIGQGYDVHRLTKGRKLVLGGIEIPSEKGAVGYSDADVLLHAISDALLGAASLGDIGRYFPESGNWEQGFDSSVILKKAISLLDENNYRVNNIDSTVVLQKPAISEYIPDMIENIARLAGLPSDQVSVKATTTDQLGFTGREEGVAAHAIALIESL